MNTQLIETLVDIFSDGLRGEYGDHPTDSPEEAADMASVAVGNLCERVMGYLPTNAFQEGMEAGLRPLTRKRDNPHGKREASERLAWKRGFKLARNHTAAFGVDLPTRAYALAQDGQHPDFGPESAEAVACRDR